MQFCGSPPSSGKREYLVYGLLANLGVGKVSLSRFPLLATGLPVLGRTGVTTCSI